MPKQEVPLNTLKDFLPERCDEKVLQYLTTYKIHLTITKQRQTLLGDYRHAHNGKAHRISVNGNLNRYSFLITLLHEIAHLLTYLKYGSSISPHGKEWKMEFSYILSTFVKDKIFPKDIETALENSIKNPAASSCGDVPLMRVLKNYDLKTENVFTIEQLKEGVLFKIKDGRIFIRGEKIRTRFKCKEIPTGKMYLFNGLYEVIMEK
jgi:SprT protein